MLFLERFSEFSGPAGSTYSSNTYAIQILRSLSGKIGFSQYGIYLAMDAIVTVTL